MGRRTLKQSPFRRRGFSLVEILVAMVILVTSGMGLILVFRQGGARSEAFSAEHYSAMFIAQKIFEDLNSRIQENPHYFNHLRENDSIPQRTVVNDSDGFFRLIQNKVRLDFFDESEDLPITDDAGAAFRQLKTFSYSMDVFRGCDPETGNEIPGLLDVKITVYWKDKGGIDQQYEIRQIVQGNDQNVFKEADPAKFPEFASDAIAKSLWSACGGTEETAPRSFEEFMSKNQGDRELVLAVGTLVHLWAVAEAANLKYNDGIDQIRRKRDLAAASGEPGTYDAAIFQEKAARLFEEKAAVQAALFARALPAVRKLAGKTLSRTDLGEEIFKAVDSVAGYVWKASFLPERIAFDFDASRALLGELLSPAYKKGFSGRKVGPILCRIVDLHKMGFFLAKEVGMKEARLKELKELLGSLNSKLKGRQPHFLEFLNMEFQICTSMETLEAYFGGESGMAGILSTIGASRETLQTIYRGFPPKP